MKLVEIPELRKIVLDRITEIGFNDTNFLKDCEKKGLKIDAARWNKYRNDKDGKINDEQLKWVCMRLGIDIRIRFGKPYIEGTELKWRIPDYNEEECLKRLNEVYPHLSNNEQKEA